MFNAQNYERKNMLNGFQLLFLLRSELAEIEKVRNKYERYRSVLFTLSPPEWQEAQQAKALRTKVLPKSAEGEGERERLVLVSPLTPALY